MTEEFTFSFAFSRSISFSNALLSILTSWANNLLVLLGEQQGRLSIIDLNMVLVASI